MAGALSNLASVPVALRDWVVIAPVVLNLGGAALLLMLRPAGRVALLAAALVVLAVLGCDAALLARVLADGPLSMTMGNWPPPFGISFTADAMGAGFALVAAFVTLVTLFYNVGEERRAEFYPLVLLLLAGVSGAFLTGDLFNLYVWFEVLLIASFGLLSAGGNEAAIDGTLKYGLLNLVATTIFLIALGFLYGLLGTLNMADIIRTAPAVNPAALASIATLLLLAFAAKAAAFPVNSWLPAAYHAASPGVSALFAGLLTKVGAYALLRTLVALLPDARMALEPAIATLAVLTLVLGPIGAIAETNLRRALGFLLIGGIGAIIAGLGLPDGFGVAGAIAYSIHAMLAMAAFYLVAGLVERRTGQTDTTLMGGLYASSVPLAVLFFALVFAVAGVPPFLGFWPKLLLLQAGVEEGVGGTGLGWLAWALVGALLLNALLSLIAGTRLWAQIFWRPASDNRESLDERGRSADGALLAAMVLTALVIGLGLWPEPLLALSRAAAADLLDPSRYIAAVGLGALP